MTDTHIITDHALGDLVRLSRDVTIDSLRLSIPQGEVVRIIDVDPETGGLVLFVCRWYDELSHCRNMICVPADGAE